MAAPRPDEITIMGFAGAMFGLGSEHELELVVGDLITEQQALVEGRLGVALAALTGVNAVRASRAVKLLTAADLCRMRINRLAQEVKLEDGSDAAKMRNQLREYVAEAQSLLHEVETTLGSSSGFAAGHVVTSNALEGMS